MNTEYLKDHLFVVTEIDGKQIGKVPVEDPFHTTNVTVGWTFWEWLKMLFAQKRSIVVRVKVQSDRVAHDRWFRDDGGPRVADMLAENVIEERIARFDAEGGIKDVGDEDDGSAMGLDG